MLQLRHIKTTLYKQLFVYAASIINILAGNCRTVVTTFSASMPLINTFYKLLFLAHHNLKQILLESDASPP
jgi:hypothetical protein